MQTRTLTRIRVRRGLFILALMVAALGLSAVAFGEPSHLSKASKATASNYVIGVTADLSSYGASTYAPIAEGFQLYMDYVNNSGGIGGHRVKLLIRDNKSDAALVTGDLRYFNSQKVNAVFYSDLSATLAAYTSRMGNTPTIYGNACYPPSTPPDAAKNFFCVGASDSTDVEAIIRGTFKAFKLAFPGKKMDLGVVSEDIPGCRSVASKQIVPGMQKRGASIVDDIVIPLSVTDMDATARKLASEGATAIIHYCLSTQEVNLASSLKRIGWKGVYMTVSWVPGVYPVLTTVKSPHFYTFDWYARTSTKVAAWRDILKTAKKSHPKYPLADQRSGWADGMVMAAALKKCGFPCSQSKLVSTMGHLVVNDKKFVQFYGTSLKWKPGNHTGPNKKYFYFRYGKGGVVEAFPGLVLKQLNG